MRNRGFSLAETLIVGLLMVVISTLIFTLVKRSGESAARGTLDTRTQEMARSVLDNITGEMGQAQLLPRSIVAAVVWPHLGLASNNQKKVPAKGKNRVIFAVATLSPSDPDFIGFNLNHYRFIEYLVVKNKKTGLTSLQRNIYTLPESGSPTGVRGVRNEEANKISLNSFKNPQESQVLLELPEKEDSMELIVSHPPDPPDSTNSFSPSLYSIKVTLITHLPGKPDISKTITLESQVWVKSL